MPQALSHPAQLAELRLKQNHKHRYGRNCGKCDQRKSYENRSKFPMCLRCDFVAGNIRLTTAVIAKESALNPLPFCLGEW